MSRSSRIIREGDPVNRSLFTRIGKIKCGMKHPQKGYPMSLDYFIATGDYANKFNEVYPEKTNKIQIVFISDDNYQSCLEEYEGRDKEGRKAGYADGRTYYLWNEEEREYVAEKDGKKVAAFSKKYGVKWKPMLTLYFLIPKIRGVIGVWQFQTSGDKSSIIAIRTVYDEVKAMIGTVVNIPFDLTVKKVTSDKPNTKTVYPVVNLIPNISAENMEILRNYLETGVDIKRLGMLTDEKLKALPTPHNENRKEVADVFEEAEEIKEEVGTPVASGVISDDQMLDILEGCETKDEVMELYENYRSIIDAKQDLYKAFADVMRSYVADEEGKDG